VETIKKLPVLGSILNLLDTYPRLSAWVVLSVGIVALLFYEARDVGLSTGNWIALIIASIVVAGLCIWIVSWEDAEEAKPEALVVKSETAPPEPSEKPAATE
jgi:K+ transporter